MKDLKENLIHRITIARESVAIREIASLLTANFIVSTIGFINVVYIGRQLTPEDYAHFAVALSMFYFLAFASPPVRMIFAKLVPEFVIEKKPGKTTTLVVIVTKYIVMGGLLLSISLVVFSNQIVSVLKLPSRLLTFLVVFYVVISLFISIGRGISNGLREYYHYNMSFYLEAGSRLLFTVLLLSVFQDSLAAFSAYILSGFIGILYLANCLRPLFKSELAQISLPSHIEFFKFLFLYSISFIGFFTIDVIMAKVYLNGSHAGYYAAASQISKIIFIIASSFNTMLLPYMTERFLRKKALLKQFLRIEGVFVSIALSVILMFILFPNQIISFSYTAKYAETKELLLPLGVATTLMAISSMIGLYMLSIRKYDIFILSMLTLLIEIILIYYNHDSALEIAQMFLISQMILATIFKIALFIIKPAKSNTV